MTNVLSFNQAIEQGLNPRDYTYEKDLIPLGTYRAKLDFKIYAKKAIAISCYFTVETINLKINLSVYRQKGDTRDYKLSNSDIDFKICPKDRSYEIVVAENSRGNIKFVSAKLLRD